MRAYDIILTIAIIVLFLGLFGLSMMSLGLKNIQDNWPKYRCNPAVMPFASMFGHDEMANFTYCVQNTQTNYMGFILEPLNYASTLFGHIGGDFVKSLDFVRKMIATIRTFVQSIVQSIFGVFMNILIEFQRIMIGIKDIVAKFVGILASIMFIIDGTVVSMQSAWNGPPGEMVRALCFHRDTLLKLRNGKFRKIKNIKLGDVLKNGSVVEGVVKLKNWRIEDGEKVPGEFFFKLPNGEKGKPVRVTPRHLMFIDGKLDFAKNHPEGRRTNKTDDYLYCLITSNHHIPIGDYTFWDWEDTPEMVKNLR
jgi:hypothetical protein